MNGRRPLLVPRANANDETVVLLRWHVAHGEWVDRGASVAEVETTKALVEIEVEEAGYLLHAVRAGDVVAVGETLGWLADRFDPEADRAVQHQPAKGGGATDRLISRDAAVLLREHGLTAADIAGTGAIRKRDVEEFLEAHATALSAAGSDSESIVDGLEVAPGSIVVYGADMQGTVVFDCIEAAGSGRVVAFVDDKPKGALSCGVPVLSPRVLARIRKRGISKAHVAISDVRAKLACAQRLKDAGFEIAGVRHPTAVVAASAAIGEGVFLGPLVLVGPETSIGDYAQINNAASVAHHSILGTASRLSDGVRIAGRVTIGAGAFLGLGVTVNEKITVGENSIVVSGVSVFGDVPPNSIVKVDGKPYPRRTS